MRKRGFSMLVALGLMMPFRAPAQEAEMAPTGAGHYSSAFYIHPISLIIGAAVDVLPLLLNFTYEKDLGAGKALIVTPQGLFWNLDVETETVSVTAFGAGLGIRKYLSKPQSGVYLQAKLNAEYGSMSIEGTDILGVNRTASGSYFGASVIGHVGTKGQFDRISMFVDGGLGFQMVNYGVDEDEFGISISGSGSGLGYDLNFGLGYNF